jgi:hypothetical protein
MKYRMIVTVAAILMAACATGVDAQTSQSVVDIPRAVELEREAYLLQNVMDKWSDAAQLLIRAARLRPGPDPVAYQNLEMAGAIYHNTRSYFKSQTTLVELAERASRHGEVGVAANAYIDASFAARKRGQPNQARTYIERAQLLATSSLLTGQEQERLTMRLEPSSPVATITAR